MFIYYHIFKHIGDYMVKIQQVSGSLLISIPKAICNAKDWKKGDELEFKIDNLGQVILRPKQV
jgi:antitoxin component of MazEF toxin-antitoxin module